MYRTQYAAPPQYTYHQYRSPPVSPYEAPRYTVYTASTPSPKAHARRATEDYGYSYATPRQTTYRTVYTSPKDATPKRTSSARKPDYVSGSDRTRKRTASGGYTTYQQTYHAASPQRAYDGVYDQNRREEYLSAHDRKFRYSPPPEESRNQTTYRSGANADGYGYHDQVPVYTRVEETTFPKSRARRSSEATKSSPPKAQFTTSRSSPQATDADARRAGIPAGYSYKHWDPTEEPILLLGSVFDANSLGKWIYDWTVACHGRTAPMTDVAGELWLLLIQLAHKIRLAEEALPRIKRASKRELLEDFLDSGERLWQRFNKLLKVCEAGMLKAAKKDSKNPKKVVVGNSSGMEFINCIFGRDRELQRTEKLMAGIRLWSMRFDANCEDIINKAKR